MVTSAPFTARCHDKHSMFISLLRVVQLGALSVTCGPWTSSGDGGVGGGGGVGIVLAQMPFDVNPYLPPGVPPGAPGFPIFDPDIDNVDARGGVVASAIFAYLPSFSPDLSFGDASVIIWARAVRLVAQFGASSVA